MKQRIRRFQVVLISLSLVLTSCRGQVASKEGAPVLFISTPTPTITLEQTSLSGTVFLLGFAGQGGWPFAYYVELRKADSQKIIGKLDIETSTYKFENIKPGTYELWILIPSETLSLKNCYDIGLPDSTWKLGQMFGENQTLIIEDIGYREAFFQAVNTHPSDQKVRNFYAVLDDLEIELGADIIFDVNLICKLS